MLARSTSGPLDLWENRKSFFIQSEKIALLTGKNIEERRVGNEQETGPKRQLQSLECHVLEEQNRMMAMAVMLLRV
jgi:hypothetical protein